MNFNPGSVRVLGTCATRLGEVVLAASRQGLCGTWFVGQKHFPELPAAPGPADDALLLETGRQLADYLDGARQDFDLPLDLSAGTPFQQTVWQALLRIPRGTTITYGQLAAGLGRPRAVRAVAAAIGRNPVSVIVPCHRVVGADGSLTGYAGGLARKQALLELEVGG